MTQIEIERANFGCDFDFNRKQQTRLLEGEYDCFFKLHKPITFQVGENKSDVLKYENFPSQRKNAKKLHDYGNFPLWQFSYLETLAKSTEKSFDLMEFSRLAG